ncbi:hypothetical protein ACTL6U_06475 [Rhodovibrionaceae bacterium A322]
MSHQNSYLLAGAGMVLLVLLFGSEQTADWAAVVEAVEEFWHRMALDVFL